MMLYQKIILIITLINFMSGSHLFTIEAQCEQEKQYLFKVVSNELYVSSDAVVDNTGGYVDIPHQNYYLKLDNEIFTLESDVIINDNNHTFSVGISENIIKGILNSKTHLFIQKIELSNKNKKSNTYNIMRRVKIALDVKTRSIEKIYNTCKKR